MKISIDCNYDDIKNESCVKEIKEYKSIIKECIKLCLEEEKILANNVEIYFKFTNDDEMQSINKQYRNIDKTTDVLSFPVYEKDELNCFDIDSQIPLSLGDVIISVPKIIEQSKEYKHSLQRELMYLVTHALFHLLGYDHMEVNDKKIMRAKEEKIMEKLEIYR